MVQHYKAMSTFFANYQKIKDSPQKKKRIKRYIIIGLLVVISISLFLILKPAAVKENLAIVQETEKKIKKTVILDAWQARDYQGVYHACNASLEYEPLDSFYLTFKGFSIFYIGISEVDGELRLQAMDETIFSLRKALVNENLPLLDMVNYVLGKAYYYKGFEYFDDALVAFDNAISAGLNSPDIWEYMALASQELGFFDNAIAYFQKALQFQPESAELMMAASKTYFAVKNLPEAERLAQAAIFKTSDEFIAEQAQFLLVTIYENSNRYQNAMLILDKLKLINPNSADVFYHEGIIFSLGGDAIKARASWRKAVAIDPMHAGARQKLLDRP